MEKNTKSATSATRTATANAKSAAKTTTPKTAAAATTPTPAAPAIGFLPKVAVVDPIKGTPAEAKPAAALKLTKSEIVPPISAAAEEAKPATTAKTETKPAAEAKQEKPTEAAKETPKTETPQEQPAKETPKKATPAPAAKTEQKPAEPTPAPAPAPLSAEEAAAAAIRAAEEADRKRRESLAEMQKRLDEELEKLNHKREIAEKREMFIKCREDIENYIGELEDEEEFETSICRLSFERFTKDGLNREEFKKVMTVSNTAIVKKFCEAMSAEICAKVGEIENELLTA